MSLIQRFRSPTSTLMGAGLVALVTIFAGCSNEKEVLDVETPGGELEVNENTETGEIDVEAEEN